MPNGRTFLTDRNQRGQDAPQVPTGVELQTGPAPHGILHRFTQNILGIIGNDVNYWPTTQDHAFIPHRAMIKSPMTGIGKNGPTIDDTAYIPSFAVGDPWG